MPPSVDGCCCHRTTSHETHATNSGVALVITLFLMAVAVGAGRLDDVPVADGDLGQPELQDDVAGALRRRGGRPQGDQLPDEHQPTSHAGAATAASTPGTSPVQYSGHDVVLSTVRRRYVLPGHAPSRRPSRLRRRRTLAARSTPPTLNYTATAKLLSMQPVNVYGGGIGYIQTWEITRPTGTRSRRPAGDGRGHGDRRAGHAGRADLRHLRDRHRLRRDHSRRHVDTPTATTPDMTHHAADDGRQSAAASAPTAT